MTDSYAVGAYQQPQDTTRINSGLSGLAGGLVLGGAAGAATGYLTSSAVKDGEFVDKFIKSSILKNAGEDIKKANVENLFSLSKMKELTAENRATFENYLKNLFSAEDLKKEFGEDGVSKATLDKLKTYFTEQKETADFIISERKAALAEFIDTKTGKLKDLAKDAGEETKKAYESTKSLLSKMKWTQAGIYGAIGAAVLGFIGYGIIKASNSNQK